MADATPRERRDDGLSSVQRAHLLDRLRGERDRLNDRILAQQERARQELEPSQALDDREDRSDRADSALAFGSRFTEQQREIDDAISRIERGQYGVCEDCGRAIDVERLEAQPTARRCREHARRADGGHPPTL
jgi:DnaK suppressor protein